MIRVEMVHSAYDTQPAIQERAMAMPTDTLIQATATILAAQIAARANRTTSMPVMHAKTTLARDFVEVYRSLEHAITRLSDAAAQVDAIIRVDA